MEITFNLKIEITKKLIIGVVQLCIYTEKINIKHYWHKQESDSSFHSFLSKKKNELQLSAHIHHHLLSEGTELRFQPCAVRWSSDGWGEEKPSGQSVHQSTSKHLQLKKTRQSSHNTCTVTVHLRLNSLIKMKHKNLFNFAAVCSLTGDSYYQWAETMSEFHIVLKYWQMNIFD